MKTSDEDRKRCDWVTDDPLYRAYHDHEWGVPCRDERQLFEMLILEGAQAGLSWLTVLRRREGYRRAFDQFDVGAIAGYEQKKVDSLLAKHRLEAEIMPSGWPIDGGWVSSHYGKRSDPLNGKRSVHHGVDIAAKRYTPIHTVAAGIVSYSGRRTGYGRVVEITHGNGYTTIYAHNQNNKVKVGERVKKGQTIALVGSSGRATGPHLHFEVKSNGTRINPSQFLRASR